MNMYDQIGSRPPVILSAAKNLPRQTEILRCAQNDSLKVDWEFS
jgi:hypothetical protein